MGKQERLKSRKAIELVFKTGKSFSIYPLRIVFQLAKADASKANPKVQAGFTVSTRYFKNAVDRNYTRRLMREAYRLQKNELQQALSVNAGELLVFFIYIAKELPTYQFVFEKTTLVIDRLIKLVSEHKQ